MTAVLLERNYTTDHVTRSARCSYRQADYFARVLGVAPGGGSGTLRTWTAGEAIALAAVQLAEDGPRAARSLVASILDAYESSGVPDYAVKVGGTDWWLTDDEADVLAVIGAGADVVRVLRLAPIKERFE